MIEISPNLQINPTFKLPGRINAAVWPAQNGNTYLLAREVKHPAPQNQPDKGNLVFLEIDQNEQVVQEKVVWRPRETAQFLLEDPRAYVCPNGQVLLGLTALPQNGRGDIPYPALATVEGTNLEEELQRVKVIDQFGPGKNTTPIDEHTFLFRKEGKENNHKLLVIRRNGESAQALEEISFPENIPWATHRIGTAMPPIRVNDQEALMVFHGIKIEGGKVIYSLGRTRLIKNNGHFQLKVDYHPLLTPDHFLDDQGQPLVEELHPERRVVYVCGGILKRIQEKEILSSYVNVADRQTREVRFSWRQLTQDAWFLT